MSACSETASLKSKGLGQSVICCSLLDSKFIDRKVCVKS
jgi:hypothetical protein